MPDCKFVHKEHSTTLTMFGGQIIACEYKAEQEEDYNHFPNLPSLPACGAKYRNQ